MDREINFSYDCGNRPDCLDRFMVILFSYIEFINLIMGYNFSVDRIFFISDISNIPDGFRNEIMFPSHQEDGQTCIVVNLNLLTKVGDIDLEKILVSNIVLCLAILFMSDAFLSVSAIKNRINSPKQFYSVVLLNMAAHNNKYSKRGLNKSRWDVV